MSSSDASSKVVDTPTLSLPAPIYRHAAPSGPWPWVDFDTDFSSSLESKILSVRDDKSDDPQWSGYPESLFGNWTRSPVERSKMLTQCSAQRGPCFIYSIDVMNDGEFKIPSEQGQEHCVEASKFWLKLQDKETQNVHVRALFVDNLTVPVLKMLGTRYNIEPFFFSSSTNWIPSRYQEEVELGQGDHITVTLPFVRTPKKRQTVLPPSSSLGRKSTIDVLAPLHLHDENVLLIDLLAVHMIRDTDSSTIITYHPSLPGRTTATRLHQVMIRAGASVYWNKIFKASKDPTFFFLAILWYALYAWDEAFEVLYVYIKDLETTLNDLDFTYTVDLNHRLHSLQAHLLHYQSLLYDFEKSVAFVKDTPNRAMKYSDEEERKTTEGLMQRECKNLLSEIDRLHRKCPMFLSRLKNATDLAFATVNIQDSRQTQKISYLTMVFLPASFTASVFGMNVVEINPGSLETIASYVRVTLFLTVATTWVIIALQPYSSIHKSGGGVLQRAAWPAFYLYHGFMERFGYNLLEKDSPSSRRIRRGGRAPFEGTA
ncbi:hypothetical protein DFH29DRAFT_216037 [Suillus ampliporus]|nr:hypothetical protein DFH29DRAFT_216037 [Suillus ampliporus]